MSFIVLVPLVAALATAILAWQYATRLDRQSLEEGRHGDPSDQWHFVLGALVIAVIAVTALQAMLLGGLRFLGG
jgi:hypothetical protein